MKKLIVLFLAFTGLILKAQTSCQTSAPFCAGGTSGVTFPATTGQTGNAPNGPFYGCLGSTPNAAWYYMQIGASGSLDLLIEGQINGGQGADVDFICWGPYSTLANVCNSLTASFTVDCSYSGSYTETLNIPNGVSGQYYMVLITNFANATQNIVFTQIGGTGNTNCDVLQVANQRICAGSSATLVASNPSNFSSPSYSISPSAIASNNGSFVISPLVTTNYTLSVTGYTGSGSPVTQTAVATISVFPQPSVSPVTAQSTCTNAANGVSLNLTFLPQNPAPGYTITWPGTPPGVFTPTTTSGNNIFQGNYAFTVTAAGGCSTSSTFTINPPPGPANFTLSPVGPYSITCATPSMIISSNNTNLTYTWTNNNTFPSYISEVLVNITNLGQWVVTAVNPTSQCVSTQTFVLYQNTVTPSGIISPVSQNISCVTTASTVSLTATNPTINVTHYIFSPGGALYSAAASTVIYGPPGQPGPYRDSLVNHVNGCYVIKTFSVSSTDNFPTLTFTSTPANYTLGCSSLSVTNIQLLGETTPTAGGQISYAMLVPNGPPPNFTSANVYSINAPGTYTAISQDNSNNCQTRIPFTIVQNIVPPNIGYTATTETLSCATPTAGLLATTTTPYHSFAWSYPGPLGPPVVVTVPDVTVGITTNATSSVIANYTLTITNTQNLCPATLVVPMRQNTRPPFAIIGAPNTSVTCKTQTLQVINSSKSYTPTSFSTNQPVFASWAGPSPQAPVNNAATYVAAVPGVYTMTARDANNGCTSTATVEIKDNRTYPSIAAAPVLTIQCSRTASAASNVSVSITNSVSGDSYTYFWIPPTSQAILSPTSTVAAPVIFDGGEYRVLVTNTKNGCSTIASRSVVTGSLTTEFSVSQTSGYAPLTVNFTNLSTAGEGATGTKSISSTWSFGNGIQIKTDSINTPVQTTYNQPGTYTVTLYSNKGAASACNTQAKHIITVDIPSRLEIPNVFTPNGDGINDVFFLKVSNLTEINAQIFDRWGHKVYELVSSTGNIEWDGMTMQGKKASAGTYFYIIKATGKDGQAYDNKGVITLYR